MPSAFLDSLAVLFFYNTQLKMHGLLKRHCKILKFTDILPKVEM